MINQYKPPKNKIITLFNFCNILTTMITEKNNKNKTGKKIAGADEVFPLVVYAILKGNVRKLKSNLKYIQLFRHETRLESQEEYYFTTINSALEFIENSNYNKLNIRESDFNNACDESDKIELERMKTSVIVSKSNKVIIKYLFLGNTDENFLLYHLSNGKKQEDSDNYIELSDFNQNISLNTDSSLPKVLVSGKANEQSGMGIFQVNLEKLYKEYFYNVNFTELTFHKIEKMYNDFRIILKLVEFFKNSYGRMSKESYKNINNTDTTEYTSGLTTSFKKIYTSGEKKEEKQSNQGSTQSPNNTGKLIDI